METTITLDLYGNVFVDGANTSQQVGDFVRNNPSLAPQIDGAWRAKLTETRGELASKDAQIASLTSELASKDADKASALAAQDSAHASALAAKDAEIAALQAQVAALTPPEPAPGVVILTPLQLLGRLTPEEEAALYASTDLAVVIVRNRLIAASEIRSDDPRTAEGKAILIDKGIVTAERAEAIFA